MKAPTRTKKWALGVTGGLSYPSKMPCPAWSISAKRCIAGAKLAAIEGTVCHDCYALHGRYVFPNVEQAQERRLVALNDPDWVEAMVFLIYKEPYFRWFDAGDIQGEGHFKKIIDVVEGTPFTQHWLPTKEVAYLGRKYPDNLTVRYSVTKIDGRPSKYPIQSISVTDGTETCPAEKQDNKCGDCRDCWNPQIPIITYKHKWSKK